MNKKLGPGALLLLSLVLLFMTGLVGGGALGAGLFVGALVCFVAAIVGFIQKVSRRNKKDN